VIDGNVTLAHSPAGFARTAPRRRLRGARPGDRDPFPRSPSIRTLDTTPGEALTNRPREHIIALTNKSRTAIYNALTDIIEEEALEEMLTNFPARGVDEPVTRDFLDARIAEIDVRMAQMETRINATLDKRLTSQTRWMVAMIVAAPTVTVVLQAYFT
jgi:hypothetical protein